MSGDHSVALSPAREFGIEMHSFVENPSTDFIPASSDLSSLFSFFFSSFFPGAGGREVLNRVGKLVSKG